MMNGWLDKAPNSATYIAGEVTSETVILPALAERWAGLLSRSNQAVPGQMRSRHGVITQRMYGSQVHITVRLSQWGRRANYTVLILAGSLGVWVAMRIISAFASGRVSQILESYR